MIDLHAPFSITAMHVAMASILALHVAVHSANGAAHCALTKGTMMKSEMQTKIIIEGFQTRAETNELFDLNFECFK
jgi:hypothetical protein